MRVVAPSDGSEQAFAVNGQRPESNNYLLDGATNVDSVNVGYALRAGGCGERVSHSDPKRAAGVREHERGDDVWQ